MWNRINSDTQVVTLDVVLRKNLWKGVFKQKHRKSKGESPTVCVESLTLRCSRADAVAVSRLTGNLWDCSPSKLSLKLQGAASSPFPDSGRRTRKIIVILTPIFGAHDLICCRHKIIVSNITVLLCWRSGLWFVWITVVSCLGKNYVAHETWKNMAARAFI